MGPSGWRWSRQSTTSTWRGPRRCAWGSGSFHPVHVPDPAGPLMADHAWADGGAGGASLPVEPAVGGLGDAPEDPVAEACGVLLHVPDGEAVLLQGVEGLELLPEAEAGSGDNRESPPLGIAGLEDPVHRFLRLRVPLPAHRPRVGVFHPVLAGPHLFQEHEEPEEYLLGEEPRHHLGHGELL